jgi:hypothetical protein
VERCLACEAVVNSETSSRNALGGASLYRQCSRSGENDSLRPQRSHPAHAIERNQTKGVVNAIARSPRPRKRGSAPQVSPLKCCFYSAALPPDKPHSIRRNVDPPVQLLLLKQVKRRLSKPDWLVLVREIQKEAELLFTIRALSRLNRW